jgi:MFS family permease
MSQPALSGKSAGERAASRSNLRYAWYVVFALTAVYMLSYMDRVILSLLVAPMKRDLGISDTQYGVLTGLAFAMFYTLLGLPLGRLADTRSRRNLIAVGVVLWSCFTSLSSVARSYGTLFLARMGVGVGEASLSPAAYSLIADYFPKERLAVAISVYYMGVFLGSSMSMFLTGSIIDHLAHTPVVVVPLLGAMASWRIVFLIVGIPGVLFALLAYTVREPQRRDVIRNAAGARVSLSYSETAAEIRKRWQSLLGISVGSIFQAIPAYALLSWTPTYFQRVHGWTPGQSGRVLATLLLAAGCTGMFAGGWFSDHWQKRGVREAPLRVGVVCGVGTILLPLGFLAPSIGWTLTLMAPGIFFLSWAMGTSSAALQRIFPNQVRGQVSALYLFSLNLAAQTLGPLMPGVFNDHLFHNPKMIGPSLAITMGTSAILMIFAFRATYASYRGDYAALETETTVKAG